MGWNFLSAPTLVKLEPTLHMQEFKNSWPLPFSTCKLLTCTRLILHCFQPKAALVIMCLKTTKNSCNIFYRKWQFIQWFITKPPEAQTKPHSCFFTPLLPAQQMQVPATRLGLPASCKTLVQGSATFPWSRAKHKLCRVWQAVIIFHQ